MLGAGQPAAGTRWRCGTAAAPSAEPGRRTAIVSFLFLGPSPRGLSAGPAVLGGQREEVGAGRRHSRPRCWGCPRESRAPESAVSSRNCGGCRRVAFPTKPGVAHRAAAGHASPPPRLLRGASPSPLATPGLPGASRSSPSPCTSTKALPSYPRAPAGRPHGSCPRGAAPREVLGVRSVEGMRPRRLICFRGAAGQRSGRAGSGRGSHLRGVGGSSPVKQHCSFFFPSVLSPRSVLSCNLSLSLSFFLIIQSMSVISCSKVFSPAVINHCVVPLPSSTEAIGFSWYELP